MDWKNLIGSNNNKSRLYEIALTTHCNANCPLCPRTDKDTGVRKESILLEHISFDDCKNFIDQIQPRPIDIINFCGDYGDPVMHPDIEKLIDYVIQTYKSSVHFDTNGSIRNEDFYDRISKYKDKIYIHFSLDGFDHDTNHKYRIGVDFNKAFKNLKAFSKNNPRNCCWKMIIFDYNYKQIDQVASFCKENNIQFYFYLNTRIWKHKVEDKDIVQYVKQKQYEYRHLTWNTYENTM